MVEVNETRNVNEIIQWGSIEIPRGNEAVFYLGKQNVEGLGHRCK